MAGERFIGKAVASLVTFVAAGLPAQLRAVETAESLAVGALTDPVAVVAARVPFDNRSPLVEISEESWRYLNVRNKLVAVDCSIAVSYASDADVEAGKVFMRRYLTAMLALLASDRELGGAVVECIPTDGDSTIVLGNQSQTRHVWAQGVDVHVLDA